MPIGERRVAVFTRWARTGDSHLRALGITRDGTDAFDPAQDDRDPADVTALLADQLGDGTNLTEVSEPATTEQLEALEPTPRRHRRRAPRRHPRSGGGQPSREPEPVGVADRAGARRSRSG